MTVNNPSPHIPKPNPLYEELPEWYLRQKEDKEKIKAKDPQLEFNIPFGWTE